MDEGNPPCGQKKEKVDADFVQRNGEAVAHLLGSLEGLCAKSKHTDFTIVCGNYRKAVHKVILCGQSDYFRRLFDQKFKETEESMIELQEDDPEVMEAVVQFIYGFDYDAPVSSAAFHVRVLVAADKYFISSLCKLASKKFHDRLASHCLRVEFVEAVSELYNKAQPDSLIPLKQAALRVMIREYLPDSSSDQQDMRELLLRYHSLCADIIIIQTEAEPVQRMIEDQYQCNQPRCNTSFKVERAVGQGGFLAIMACPRCQSGSYKV